MLKVILRIFLHLLDKHFGRNHKYHKIFNRNNVKISYSCIDNIKCNVKSEVFNCLTNIVIYSSTLKYNCTFIRNNIDRYVDIDI